MLHIDESISAGTFHASRRAEAETILAKHGMSAAAYDHLQSLGRSALELFCARLAVQIKCASVGEASASASLLRQQVAREVDMRVAEQGAFKFGAQMPEAERLNQSVRMELVHRFVGCWAYFHGYGKLVSELLHPVLGSRPIQLASLKDPKTVLQEYLQSRKHGTPHYELSGTSGEQHKQIFTVKVTALGKACSGSGLSKKQAEAAAALEFITKYVGAAALPVGPKVSTRLADMCGGGAPIASNRMPAVRTLIDRWKLPSHAEPLLVLALIHQSAASEHNVLQTPLGKDNRLLAFLGSSIFQYTAAHLTIQHLAGEQIRSGGGIGSIVANVASDEALSTLSERFEHLGLRLLVAKSQHAVPGLVSARSQVVQAIVGAITLAREGEGAELLLPKVLEDDILIRLHAIARVGSEAIPVKTRFQELCQALRIPVAYASERTKGKTALSVCSVRLSSEYQQTLNVSFPTQVESHHEASPLKSREADLARFLLNVLSSIAGSSTRKIEGIRSQHRPIADWFSVHINAFLEQLSVDQNLVVADRVARMGLLAISPLRDGNYVTFEEWNRLVALQGIRIPKALRETVYRPGDGSALRIAQKQLLQLLAVLETSLSKIDALSSACTATGMSEYADVVSTATIFRLLNTSVEQLAINDLVLSLQLLNRARGFRVTSDVAERAQPWEISGSLLVFIEEVVTLLYDNSENVVLQLSAKRDRLCIEFKFESSKNGFDWTSLVSDSKLLQVLCRLIPVVAVSSNLASFTVETPLNSDVASEPSGVLQCWWSYQVGDRLQMESSGIVATYLHDLKNEMSAMFVAAGRAREAETAPQRYLLAHSAATHAEEAMTKLRAARSALAHTGTLSLQPVEVSDFFRDLAAQVLVWLPRRVSLELPILASSDQVYTDAQKVRSILMNLVRNAVFAMKGNGHLAVNYSYDPVRSGLSISVTDTGPGLAEAQLSTLKLGRGLPSSTRSGPGVGLLSVLLLIRELNGKVDFQNEKPCGLRVDIWIPSSSQSMDWQSPADRSQQEEEVVLHESAVG